MKLKQLLKEAMGPKDKSQWYKKLYHRLHDSKKSKPKTWKGGVRKAITATIVHNAHVKAGIESGMRKEERK